MGGWLVGVGGGVAGDVKRVSEDITLHFVPDLKIIASEPDVSSD